MKPTPKGSLSNSLSSDRSKVKVKVTKRSKAYICHNTLSSRLIHMKPTPKCSLFNFLSSDRSKVKVKVTKVSKTTGLNCMKFSGMICHHPRTNRLEFGSEQVKGQGHEKVKNVFLS